MIRKLKSIYHIIPKKFQKKSLRYSLFSVLNVFFDLLSIAYIIPLFVFILDKDQMPTFIQKISFFNEEYLIHWVVGILLLFVVKNYFQIAIIKFQSKLVFDIATALSSGLTKQFLRSPLSSIQHLNKGKEIQKIQMAGTHFSNHILLSINSILTELLIIGFIAIVSFILYPKFSILIFLIALICLYSLYRMRKKKIQKISTSIRKSYSKATSHLLNIIDGFLEIKSLGKESFFQEKYEETLAEFNDNFAILKKHQNSNSKYLEVFVILALCLFLYSVHISIDAPSERVLLISYIAGISLKLFPSINKLILAYTNFRSYQYTLDVLTAFEPNSESKNPHSQFVHSVSLKKVSYSYGEDKDLLENINLSLNRGEIVGIKGRSGIGKTTLLYLVMGFLSPKRGSLFVDEQIINSSNILFPFIGYVPQQPFLFQGSFLDNIVMGTSANDIDFERIKTLIHAFDMDSYIENLKDGLDTKISHNSLSVSGGQKQRLALIRALYRNPDLLILDEVTNQLDEELEIKVLNYLKDYAKEMNIAILLVSHSNSISEICERTYQITNHTLQAISFE